MGKTRGAGESLERHTSDCFKILMKLKLFIMNTGRSPSGDEILNSFLVSFCRSRSCEGQFRASDQPRVHVFIPPGTAPKLSLMLTPMPSDVVQRCQEEKSPVKNLLLLLGCVTVTRSPLRTGPTTRGAELEPLPPSSGFTCPLSPAERLLIPWLPLRSAPGPGPSSPSQ